MLGINISQTSKVASKYLKVVLLVILIINSFSYIIINIAAYEMVRGFPFISLGTQEIRDSLEKESYIYIKKDRLYADFLLPSSSKIYVTEALEKCILILSFAIDTEKAMLEVNLVGPVDRTKLNIERYPEPYIYYARNSGEVRIMIRNPQKNIVYYRFFVDTSESVGDSNSKILPLEGGEVAFHIDLRRDDRVNLSLISSNYLNLEIWVFALCYEMVLGEGSYMLCSYKETLDRTFFFTADLGGRYYVIIESVDGEGTVSLKNVIDSPSWNQEWFWVVCDIVFVAALSLFFLVKMKKISSLEKDIQLTLISYYFWFITIGLSISVIGSFNYGTWIHVSLFYFLIFFYWLSLGVQIYVAYLDRKKTNALCPYCSRKVDLKKDNYCCGHIVKNISFAWFLLPLSFGFLFFIISYFITEWIFRNFLSASLWVGSCGSIIGGIFAWWINRTIHRIKSWKFLVAGILLSLPLPLIIGFLIDVLSQPHVELEWLGKLIRIRIAPLTIPSGIALPFTILAVGSALLIANQIRKIAFSKKSASKKLR